MFEKIIIAFIMISALVRFLINDITEMHMFVMFIFGGLIMINIRIISIMDKQKETKNTKRHTIENEA